MNKQRKQPSRRAIAMYQKIVQEVVREVIAENVSGKKNEDDASKPVFTPEQKRAYLEAISRFNEYGSSVYRENNLKEITEQMRKMVEFASHNITEESGEWFDGVTIGRHTKKLSESFKLFEKTANEMYTLQQRLESVYEEIGETLGKYYEINGKK
ncbi:hypothetical protein [Microcystis phage Mel-JY01]